MSETKLPDIVERLREQYSEQFKEEQPAEVIYRYQRERFEAADEIIRLSERLEMTHAWKLIDGKMQRIAVELDSIPDGIECRDETIKLQDAEITRLRSRAGWHEAIEAKQRAVSEALCRNQLSGTAVVCAGVCSGTFPGQPYPCEHALTVWDTDADEVLRALLPPGGEKG